MSRRPFVWNDKIQEEDKCAVVPSGLSFGGFSGVATWMELVGQSSGIKMVEAAFLSGFFLGLAWAHPLW